MSESQVYALLWASRTGSENARSTCAFTNRTHLIHNAITDNVSYVNLRTSYVSYGAIYSVLTNLRLSYIMQLGVEKGLKRAAAAATLKPARTRLRLVRRVRYAVAI